jgi:hypothetical protein
MPRPLVSGVKNSIQRTDQKKSRKGDVKMIDIEKLKPILQDVVSEDNMPDVIVRVSEIDEAVDNSALEEANATIEKLKEQNKKLTDIFFTGKNEKFDDAPLPDESAGTDDSDEDDSPETFEDLFENE